MDLPYFELALTLTDSLSCESLFPPELEESGLGRGV